MGAKIYQSRARLDFNHAEPVRVRHRRQIINLKSAMWQRKRALAIHHVTRDIDFGAGISWPQQVNCVISGGRP